MNAEQITQIKERAEIAEALINELHTERLDYHSEYLPLIDSNTDIPALLSHITEQDATIKRLEGERDALKMDISIACIAGESCAVCANSRNRGDRFPCAIANEWCCGAGWEWRGTK